jgi:DNA invertase Pin-like site-specific DNA recombinase
VNTKKREGFKKMVADGLAGKFDLLVTKSASRFARNTVDSLTTVRKLKEKGVEVWFEKENICTLDSKGDDGLPEIVPIDAELAELRREIEVVAELSRKAIYENARTAQRQTDFNERNKSGSPPDP